MWLGRRRFQNWAHEHPSCAEPSAARVDHRDADGHVFGRLLCRPRILPGSGADEEIARHAPTRTANSGLINRCQFLA